MSIPCSRKLFIKDTIFHIISVNKDNSADIIYLDFCKAIDLILHDILLKIVLKKKKKKINVAYFKWMEKLVTCIKK